VILKLFPEIRRHRDIDVSLSGHHCSLVSRIE
jgi:hypothetical protein